MNFQPPPSLDGVREIELDFETTGRRWWAGDVPGSCGICIDGQTFFLAWRQASGNNISEEGAKEYFRRELRNKRITNLSTAFEVHMAHAWGIDLEAQRNEVSDVAHWAALIDDHRKKFSLEALAKTYLPDDEQKVLSVGGEELDMTRAMSYSAKAMAERAMGDVRQVWLLKQILWRKLDAMNLQRVRALEDEVIYAACEMERNAAPLDVEKLVQWEAQSAEDLEQACRKVSRAIGRNFQESLFGGPSTGFLNPDSPKDMLWLFKKLDLPVTYLESGRPTFTAEVLSHIDHPIINLINEQSRILDLRSKYLVPYLEAVRRDGVLRFKLHQLRTDEKGTVRGRFSSSDKNIQQILKPTKQRKKYGPKYIIRELFIAAPGKVVVSSDAEQIEYRIFASYAGNPKVLAAYRENPRLKFHNLTLDLLQVHKPDIDYDKAKTLNFLCVAEDTPILRADLSWVDAGSLQAGDKLLAFDEHQRQGTGRERTRRWQISSVIDNVVIEQDCLEVETETGDTLICTPEHRWLAYKNADRVSLQWLRSDELVVGQSRIIKASTPWEQDTSWEAGWLAGFLDGEGTATASMISCAQNKGATLDFAERLLRQLHTASWGREAILRSDYTGKASRLGLRGSVFDRLSFLGRVRPGRLIADFARLLHGKMFQAQSSPRVVAVRTAGKRKIAALGTTSATYIANGYAAHNTVYGGGLAKLALQLGFLSNARFRQLCEEYKGEDDIVRIPHTHPELAEARVIQQVYETTLPEVKPLSKKASDLAKTRGYVLSVLGRRATFPYGAGAHAALNAVIQPSAADVLKRKMVEVHKRRHEIGFTPRMTIHDQITGDGESIETAYLMDEILNQQSFPQFKVPILWGTETGPNLAALSPLPPKAEV